MRAARILPWPILAATLGLVGLGVAMVASTTARHGLLVYQDEHHFLLRHIFAVAVAVAAGGAVVRLGAVRLLAWAPPAFFTALACAVAVFLPGVGIRAAGARRWIHLGPFSVGPGPLVVLAVALLVAAWGRSAPDDGTAGRGPVRRRTWSALAALGAIALLAAEPDFSAAAVAALVTVVALFGVGVRGARLLPGALLLAFLLAVGATRFGYVGQRISAHLAPERDRRGAGWEVLALERVVVGATAQGTGLGRGEARRRLSSPETDYTFAVIIDELGVRGALATGALWALCALSSLAAAVAARDRRLRALALGAGTALVAPAGLHAAVCLGLVPITGVAMPLVSYDPVATAAAGLAIGAVLAVVRSAPPHDA